MLYYVEAGVAGAWADPNNIQSTVVDAEPGTPFEAQAMDINLDGEEKTAKKNISLACLWRLLKTKSNIPSNFFIDVVAALYLTYYDSA